MASHRQHHCQHHLLSFPPSASTCCCAGSCSSHCCNPPCPPSPPPPHSSVDPLVQALASLLQQQQQQQQQRHHHHQPQFQSSSHHYEAHSRMSHSQSPNLQPQKLHLQQQDERYNQTQLLISSLLQRINTLESSLNHFSSRDSAARYSPSYLLRDAAARVIQTHFRAFLVRRSRALRQLQDLAFIKSSFNSLKSSISQKIHFDFELVSSKAMDLLFRLDSVQGDDPMIRDGKRSISRDLVRFLDFIDGFAVKKRHAIQYKSARNFRVVGNGHKSRALNANNSHGGLRGQRKVVKENLRDRIERIRGFSRVNENDEQDVELEGFQQFLEEEDDDGEDNPKIMMNSKYEASDIRSGVLVKKTGSQPKVKKTVSFAEDGNAYRVFDDSHELVSNGDDTFANGSDSTDDHEEDMEVREVEGRCGISMQSQNDGEAYLENGASVLSKDGEKNLRMNRRSAGDYEINVYCQDEDGNVVFSAPVPVKMEPRDDLMKKKPVKITT